MTTTTVDLRKPRLSVAAVTVKGRVIGAHGPFPDPDTAAGWIASLSPYALFPPSMWAVHNHEQFRAEHPRMRLIRPQYARRTA